MNVYDFDETVYCGDSTRDFYFHCLKKYPGIIKYLPAQAVWFIKFAFKRVTKTQFKEQFYRFFKSIPDIDEEVNLFWKNKKNNLKKWYINQKREDDLIISASPEFLLMPICSRLNVKLIASKVDKHTGKTESENCYGQEKVIRFNDMYDGCEIEEFYSDSLSDTPLALIAKKAYIVDGDIIKPFPSVK